MKILQIGKFYPICGGVEKVMYDITVGLSQRQIYCDMLCAAAENHPPGNLLLNQFARILCVPSWKKVASTMLSPAMVYRLRKIRKEYDIIHIHHPDPMACLALFLSGYKGPVVLHWHSDILKQKRLLKLYAPLQNWLMRRAEVIVGTTPVYVRESPFLEDIQRKVTSIPIGVDEMKPSSERVSQIREKYAGKKIIFSLGRLVEYKGYEYLIRAARRLSDEYIILIGGKGPLWEYLQALIDELGVADKVKLLGFIEDRELPDYFGACDLFCLSSIWKTEAFGIVQIEAMSCGKPVIAMNIPESGVNWVNMDRFSGLNVKPEDADALAEAITAVLTDKALYEKLSQGARKRYETMFTKELMTELCLNLYRMVLNNNEKIIV
ncbi:glycosyltransferase family 4 protein [Bacteroides sp.]|uniref:glycosyltransferase family 4 protein n=1 Tax=Bacteroides sp. TaxID=29523 RepID=UPI0025C41A0E|nr:glycosyltransferase family 4 protein [Bacteroides sp.]